MNYRILGKTGWKISEVSLGTWQVGGGWGSPVFNDALADRIIHAAIDNGINFIDTADVYSSGLSEKAVARVVKTRSEKVYVATKCGRRLKPQHTAEGYNRANITGFVEDSLKNMGLDTLDLIQLHCPPSAVYDSAEVFGILDDLKQQGKIRQYGVSVEKVSEALKALQYPGVATVQIIFNMMRLKPAEDFFSEAQKANVGILARVPLASGLLTGKINQATTFSPHDHRFFNREGEAFDKGETFSGVNLDLAFQALKEYKRLFGELMLAEYALRWILMFEAVSCVIPGASSVEQVLSNVKTSQYPALPKTAMKEVEAVYNQFLRPTIHSQW
ncbi:MAG: aldo/keto reductase [Bacteroidia bacterium]|nr:aldo/keto reductase [Bacteroidia bacterium]